MDPLDVDTILSSDEAEISPEDIPDTPEHEDSPSAPASSAFDPNAAPARSFFAGLVESESICLWMSWLVWAETSPPMRVASRT